MSGMTASRESPIERLETILVELEVSPTQLRRDPSGRAWLPPEARSLVESSRECADALDDFVSGELELWGSLPDPSSGTTVDPFFTARVVESLPGPRLGTGLSPRRRAMVLGLFHIVAGVLAYAVLTMVPESTARWAEQAHEMLSWGSQSGSSMLVTATGVGAALLVAFVASRIHTPTA